MPSQTRDSLKWLWNCSGWALGTASVRGGDIGMTSTAHVRKMHNISKAKLFCVHGHVAPRFSMTATQRGLTSTQTLASAAPYVSALVQEISCRTNSNKILGNTMQTIEKRGDKRISLKRKIKKEDGGVETIPTVWKNKRRGRTEQG